jgi:sugar lactone lactonase YvrE
MLGMTRRTGLALAAGTILLAACAEDPSAPTIAEPGAAFSKVGSGGFRFEPLASSAQCVANGTGDRFDLPTGYTQTIITRQSDLAGIVAGTGEDLFDMVTLNENGPHAGRYLYRAHEVGSNGAVTRTDLETLETVLISQNPGYRRLDGIAWTKWGTVLFAEETGGGRIFEYFPGSGQVVDRSNMGLRSHEGIRVDPQGNVYGISETTPGYIFKFVPDRAGDLSSGRNYALKVADASRTGRATWVEIDLAAHGLNSLAAAAAVGATGWGRPEDVEIATGTGNNHGGANVMYVAITSENLVLRIHFNGHDAYVSNFIAGIPGFSAPDNLALSKGGDLYVTEDSGGPDDIWMAPTGPEVATTVVRFASLRDCDAEPTGIYFDKNGWTLFVQVQHAGWENGDDLTVEVRAK